MAKYSIVRKDKIKSSYVGNIYSVKYDSGILQNGNVGVVGDLLDGEDEIRELKVPAGVDEPLVLIYQEEINYDESRLSNRALEHFHIPQGKPARAYELATGDIYSVTPDAIDAIDPVAGVVKGNYLVAQAGSLKLKEVPASGAGTITGNEAFIGKVADKEKLGISTIVGQSEVVSRVRDLIVIDIIKNHK